MKLAPGIRWHCRQEFVGAVECGYARLEHFHVPAFGLREPIHGIGFGNQLCRVLGGADGRSDQNQEKGQMQPAVRGEECSLARIFTPSSGKSED